MSFKEIVKKHEHLDSPRTIAQAIWDEHGIEVFRLVPEAWLVSLLAEHVRGYVSKQRSKSIKSVRDYANNRVVGTRIALAGDYWSKRWLVNGLYIETRNLSISNIEHLITERYKIADTMHAQIDFLTANLELARRNGASTLGELEQKGIQLVELHKLAEAA